MKQRLAMQEEEQNISNDIASPPLIVDLDGTLTPTDTLLESTIKLAKSSFFYVILLFFYVLQGRAKAKAFVGCKTSINAELLPYNQDLLDYITSEKEKGRKIVLATAAHASIANQVSEHLGIFDQVLATENNNNLKGINKLQAIHELVGPEFSYAGDSKADIPIWKKAKTAILVNTPRNLANLISATTPIEKAFYHEHPALTDWLRALRIHQWLKNLLLFVPLFTAFSFYDTHKIIYSFIAFFSFSFAASGTYIINDLFDLESDRAHPRKRNRPFAKGTIPIKKGLVLSIASLSTGIAMASLVSSNFLLMLLLYLALTSAYSWVWKGYMLIDVIVLSLLYTLRILSGAVAIEVSPSSWLLAFSVFMFLSLALVKRCAELVSLKAENSTTTQGRDYNVRDLDVLWPLGVGSALCSIVIFGLFISSPETSTNYSTPQLLWLTAIGLLYWLSRLWIKTSRGEMDDDPVVYAVKDRGSQITILGIIFSVLLAHFISF